MKNQDLIVFGEDWGALPSSTQQLIKHLALTRDVIWVNSIGLRQPKFNRRDIQRIWHKLLALTTSTRQLKATKVAPTFTVINPTTIPAPTSYLARFIAKQLLSFQLKKILKKHRIVDPVLWISLPTAVDVVGMLGESAVIYYCCDDFDALEGVDHNTVKICEDQLLECADLVLTSSDVLTEKLGHHAITIEHGVDYQLFSNPTNIATDLPDNGNPTAGYYGSIASWVNIELLQQVISQLPDWNFVFIGEITVDVSKLKQFNNVYFLGSRPHHQLPQYSQHWTVSLLPFRHNSQIYACNPFKLREYLAAGRPIISTNFPALTPYSNLVDIVTSPTEMLKALQRAKDNSYIDPLKRQAVVNETWQVRAQQVARLMECL